MQSLRMVSTAFMGAPVFIAIALYFVLVDPDIGLETPPLWLPLIYLVAGVVMHLLLTAIGYRAPQPVQAGAPRSNHVPAFASALFLRLALSESIMMVAIALAFVVTDGGYVGFLVGAAVTLALMTVHGRPTDAAIEKFRASLERNGGISYLREDLGLENKPGGAIQEL